MITLFINKINYDLIRITKYKELYKIMYKLPYISLVGLPIKIHSCKMTWDSNIFLYIDNKEDHHMISTIDTLLSSKINNYSPIMKDNRIQLKYNQKVRDIFLSYKQNKKEFIYLSIGGILYQKKYNIHKPLVHLYV